LLGKGSRHDNKKDLGQMFTEPTQENQGKTALLGLYGPVKGQSFDAKALSWI